MQVFEQIGCEMVRDMDLVRNLLLQMESDPQLDGSHWVRFKPEGACREYPPKEINYHLTLLIDAGFVRGQYGVDDTPAVSRLTWSGHEFLADIHDPDIWDKTKARAKGLTSIGLAFIWEVAKAEIRQKLGLP
jgi:hypothetical protein